MRWIAVIYLAMTSLLYAQEASFQFEQANQLYRNGDFQKSAQMYEQIIKNGYESPAIYYNLGNSYFKLRNIPAAILNFERAKRLLPNDEDISYNLRLTNLKIIDKIEPVPQLFFINWWYSFVNLFSSDNWAVSGIILMWLTAIGYVILYLGHNLILQRITFILTVLIFLTSVLTFVGMYQRYQIEHNEQAAIVFSQTVSVKSAPDFQSVDLFVLHEGVKLEFLDAVGEWRKIRLADGKIGWLMIKDVQVI